MYSILNNYNKFLLLSISRNNILDLKLKARIYLFHNGFYMNELISRRIRSERAFDNGNRSYTGERAIFDLLSSSALNEHDRSLVFLLYIGSTNPSDPPYLIGAPALLYPPFLLFLTFILLFQKALSLRILLLMSSSMLPSIYH